MLTTTAPAVMSRVSSPAGAGEPGLAAHEGDGLQAGEHRLVGGPEFVDQGIPGSDGLFQILVRVPVAASLREIDQGLGRDTGHVDAGAADHGVVAFHQHHAPAVGREIPGQGLAGLAPADHQEVGLQIQGSG